MKRFVDGEEVTFDPSVASVEHAGDRLFVRSAEGTSTAVAIRQGDAVLVSYQGRQYRVERTQSRRAGRSAVAPNEIRATMPGQIAAVRVALGEAVEAGDPLLVLEAMKTQQPIVAPHAGTVTELRISVGQQVTEGEILAIVAKRADDTIERP